MKKILKVILIVIISIAGIIIIDTLQARLFKHSPLLSIRKNLSDDDSYVEKGLILDTYYCTKDRDIITVYWKYKFNKYTCPIDNIDELITNKDITMIIKESTLTPKGATIIITDNSGMNNIYNSAFILEKYSKDGFKEMKTIIDDYAWSLVAYQVGENNKLEFYVDWEWLYGVLEPGEYRLIKGAYEIESTISNTFSVKFKIY